MEIQGQMLIISKEIQSFQQAAIMLRDEAQMEQQFLLYPSIHLEVLLVDLAAIITGTRYQCCTANLLKANLLTQNTSRMICCNLLSSSENRNLFSYRAKRLNIINEATSPYSLTPVSSKSQKLLRSPRKASRKISKIPFKVLDAPELQDDFYLNLVDWSSQNVLSVGLGACVYLWSACTSQVTRLCDLTSDNDNVTSVSWSERVSTIKIMSLNNLTLY